MKFIAEYLLHDDEYILSKLAEYAKRAGATKVRFLGEENDIETTDLTHKGIVELVDGGEENFGLSFFDKEGNRLGWFGVVLGNQDFTTIFDYTDNPWSDKIGEAIGKVYDNPPFDASYRGY